MGAKNRKANKLSGGICRPSKINTWKCYSKEAKGKWLIVTCHLSMALATLTDLNPLEILNVHHSYEILDNTNRASHK